MLRFKTAPSGNFSIHVHVRKLLTRESILSLIKSLRNPHCMYFIILLTIFILSKAFSGSIIIWLLYPHNEICMQCLCEKGLYL